MSVNLPIFVMWLINFNNEIKCFFIFGDFINNGLKKIRIEVFHIFFIDSLCYYEKHHGFLRSLQPVSTVLAIYFVVLF